MCPMPATIETRVEPLVSLPVHQSATTTLSRRWRGRARAAWAALALLTVWLFVVGVPLHPAHPHVLCADVTCSGSESLAQVTRELHSIGLTLGFYLAYILAVKLVFATGYFAVAALIVWRRSDDWMALLIDAEVTLEDLLELPVVEHAAMGHTHDVPQDRVSSVLSKGAEQWRRARLR